MGYFKGQGYMVIAFCGTTLHIIFRAICSAIMIGKMGLTAVALRSRLDTLCDIPDGQFYPDRRAKLKHSILP